MMMQGVPRQFATFLVVGGSAALINLAARVLFSQVVIYEIAIVLAYLIAMTYAFLLDRRYVFDGADGDPRRQYTRFVIVNFLALAQVWLVSVGTLRLVFPAIGFTWHAETVAHALGVMSPAITSYFGHKYYSFRV
ncbi:MAG: putative flippase GtrA [Alphaproteobacteria bacterium]|jgi:putative flippase GtrA